MTVFCLSIHAGYRCGRSGVCCSDVWAVPIEQHVVELIRDKGLVLAGSGPYIVPSERPEAYTSELVAAHQDGWCVFYEKESRLCTIHRQHGVEALPSSCRHFPRTYLIDGRGAFVSLSHFCPTAARLLLEDGPLEIIEAEPPLALAGNVEGLDAVGALPPLLRPELLADLDGYDAWERACVAVLARSDLTFAEALDTMDAATERLRTWRPGGLALSAQVELMFSGDPRHRWLRPVQTDAQRLSMVDEVLPSSLPCRKRADGADLEPFDAAVKRYLAARLFATWLAYRTRGLRSIVEWLRICLAVLRNEYAIGGDFIEAIRETDRVLLHVIHLQMLAAELEAVEKVQR